MGKSRTSTGNFHNRKKETGNSKINFNIIENQGKFIHINENKKAGAAPGAGFLRRTMTELEDRCDRERDGLQQKGCGIIKKTLFYVCDTFCYDSPGPLLITTVIYISCSIK